jgi:hypothetical protein
MAPRAFSVATIAVVLLITCIPAQFQQPTTPRTHDTDRIDSVANAVFSMNEKLDNVLSTISRNTEHLQYVDQRLTALEARMDHRDSATAQDPATIATLKAQIDGLKDDMGVVRRAGTWTVTGVASLILAGLTVIIKRYVERGIAPLWAQVEATHQAEYRTKTTAKLEEAVTSASAAYEISNKVNDKLHTIGVKMLDDRPLNDEKED